MGKKNFLLKVYEFGWLVQHAVVGKHLFIPDKSEVLCLSRGRSGVKLNHVKVITFLKPFFRRPVSGQGPWWKLLILQTLIVFKPNAGLLSLK